ncbi:MAG: hypothetical protein IKA74_04920 [Clostridia bacterium]|nr:hypothetical protein [Clostridia bacterium]
MTQSASKYVRPWVVSKFTAKPGVGKLRLRAGERRNLSKIRAPLNRVGRDDAICLKIRAPLSGFRVFCQARCILYSFGQENGEIHPKYVRP